MNLRPFLYPALSLTLSPSLPFSLSSSLSLSLLGSCTTGPSTRCIRCSWTRLTFLLYLCLRIGIPSLCLDEMNGPSLTLIMFIFSFFIRIFFLFLIFSDQAKMAELTGKACAINAKPGGKVSFYDGLYSGESLSLSHAHTHSLSAMYKMPSN